MTRTARSSPAAPPSCGFGLSCVKLALQTAISTSADTAEGAFLLVRSASLCMVGPPGARVRPTSGPDARPLAALADANAQMALLQFISAGISRVRTPTSVHADHLIQAHKGAKADLEAAIEANREVYDFLESACAKVSPGLPAVALRWLRLTLTLRHDARPAVRLHLLAAGSGHPPPGHIRAVRVPRQPNGRQRLAHAQRGGSRLPRHRCRRDGGCRREWSASLLFAWSGSGSLLTAL